MLMNIPKNYFIRQFKTIFVKKSYILCIVIQQLKHQTNRILFTLTYEI